MTVQATQLGTLALVVLAAALGVFMIASAGRAIRRGRSAGGAAAGGAPGAPGQGGPEAARHDDGGDPAGGGERGHDDRGPDPAGDPGMSGQASRGAGPGSRAQPARAGTSRPKKPITSVMTAPRPERPAPTSLRRRTRMTTPGSPAGPTAGDSDAGAGAPGWAVAPGRARPYASPAREHGTGAAAGRAAASSGTDVSRKPAPEAGLPAAWPAGGAPAVPGQPGPPGRARPGSARSGSAGRGERRPEPGWGDVGPGDRLGSETGELPLPADAWPGPGLEDTGPAATAGPDAACGGPGSAGRPGPDTGAPGLPARASSGPAASWPSGRWPPGSPASCARPS